MTRENDSHNSVDASLWFGWAVQQYYLKTKKLQNIAPTLWVVLKEIFSHYKNGTLYNIKMRDDGLLYAGHPGVNVSWMDAMLGENQPVTPRYGLQVETNALWFNLLSFMEELADAFKETQLKIELRALIKKAAVSFREAFWNPMLECLYDFVNEEQKNAAIRPNQIFAVSLPYSPLTREMSVKVVEVIRNQLFTPYGLRTLAPNDPNYHGHYFGNQNDRDQAYHNGTIWPWLLGHFAEAMVRIDFSKRKLNEIFAPCVEAFAKHLEEYGIGCVAEIFSGDHPHEPNGCINQAWSVAEILRLTHIINLKK